MNETPVHNDYRVDFKHRFASAIGEGDALTRPIRYSDLIETILMSCFRADGIAHVLWALFECGDKTGAALDTARMAAVCRALIAELDDIQACVNALPYNIDAKKESA